MTTSIVSATFAALLFGSGATTTAPTPTGAKAPISNTTVQVSPKLKEQIKPTPKFAPLLSKSALLEGAKAKKIVPTEGDAPLTTLATLSATKSREGNFAVDFLCANVYTSWDGDGLVAWPHLLIEHCRGFGPKAGVEVVFPAEAGRAYAVECNSQASPRWRIKHKIGAGGWSPTITVDTHNPVDYVLASSAGQVRVNFQLDPVDNHVLQQGVRFCRVSRIG